VTTVGSHWNDDILACTEGRVAKIIRLHSRVVILPKPIANHGHYNSAERPKKLTNR